MSKFSDLNRAVLDAIKAGRIGQPVFVRCLIHSVDNSKESAGPLAAVVQAVQNWVGEPVHRIYPADSRGETVTLAIRFRAGASALVSTIRSRSRSGFDLIVLGNHGAMYHEGLAGEGEGRSGSSNIEIVDVPPALLTAVENAIRSGAMQVLPEGRP